MLWTPISQIKQSDGVAKANAQQTKPITANCGKKDSFLPQFALCARFVKK
jgi:hypothetical protein